MKFYAINVGIKIPNLGFLMGKEAREECIKKFVKQTFSFRGIKLRNVIKLICDTFNYSECLAGNCSSSTVSHKYKEFYCEADILTGRFELFELCKVK